MTDNNKFGKIIPAQKVAGYSVIAPSIETIRASGLPERAGAWCVWRAEVRENQPKPAKIPRDGGGAALSVSDPGKWLSFDKAATAYARGGFDGIGLLVGSVAEGEFCGLDLDRCLEADGSITVGKESLVADFVALGGYVEVSPSGRGLRQFLDSVRLEGYRQKTSAHDLEIYSYWDDRYLTLTGVVYPPGGEARPIIDNQAGLESFILKWCDKVPEAKAAEFQTGDVVDRSLDEILKLLRSHNKRGRITRLLDGDISDYEGHSEADAALCCEAAYFTRNPEVIDAVIRQSGLMREKWDSRRGRETYGSRTIRRALETQTKIFDVVKRDGDAIKAEDKARREALKAKAGEMLIGGFADLMTAKGAWRQDQWALAEILIRDRRLIGVCYFDEFSGYACAAQSFREVFADKSAPATVGRITDDHLRAVVRWLGREWGLNLRFDVATQVSLSWAQSVRVNPATRRLNELASRWDGKPRLASWLVDYCAAVTLTDEGIDLTDYLAAVGSRWLISVVARAFQPGAKVDVMLVLEGRQGARKSSAIRLLAEAIGPEYFRDGFALGDGSTKDALIGLRGRLIVEWSELTGLSRHDRNSIKNFLSRQSDPYRAPYAALEQDWPRTAVFCGSTNDSGYLGDATGNRRFWPVAVGRIDLERLRADAGLLWGEAVALYRAGQRWWIDDGDVRDARLLAIASREQSRRVGGGLWEELAADVADALVQGRLAHGGARGPAEAFPCEHFSVEQMKAWLVSQAGDGSAITDSVWLRVVDGLRRAGWESRKVSGRSRWFLSDERRLELCAMWGRDFGPPAGLRRRASI